MREIIFRGKRLDNGEWVQGFYFRKQNPCSVDGLPITHHIADLPPFGYQVDPATVGQFTGLLDKNGKQIFEGDILLINGRKDSPVYIEYENSSFECKMPEHLWYRHRLENNPQKYEVISNVYDNPELLEKAK